MAQRISQARSFFVRARKTIPNKRIAAVLRRRPFLSFIVVLGILLAVIIFSNFAAKRGVQKVNQPDLIKSVRVFEVSESPKLTVQAKIEKSGVLKISAQMPGIVNKIHVSEGQAVKKGTLLVSLATNYQGGSTPSLQRQLAYAQFKNVKDTFDTQKDIIGKQRDIATASAENTEQLRLISDRSLGETRDLLTLSENLLGSLNGQIQLLEQNDPTNVELPGLKAQQIQLQGSVNQLKSAVRGIEYQTNTQNPPTILSSKQKDIALKQLELQEKALEFNRDVSKIQLNLASINESLMFPVAPFSGVVERVYVSEGQTVNPGAALITMTADKNEITAIAQIPRQLAYSIAKTDPSIFWIEDKRYSFLPSYVSQNATDGQLYSVLYQLDTSIADALTNGEYVSVDVPLFTGNDEKTIPFLPIDSVFQTQSENIVFVVEAGKARPRTVSLGNLYGRYVEINDGLIEGDRVILSRNVLSGDKVNVEN